MAAIGRRVFFYAALSYAWTRGMGAQDREKETRAQHQEKDLRAQVYRIATALSAGDPADAMAAFSKTCPGYEKLRDDFQALTDAYDVVNEAEVMKIEESGNGTKVTVNWSMTLDSKAGEPGRQRTAELRLVFAAEKNKWKVIAISPASFFDPAAR